MLGYCFLFVLLYFVKFAFICHTCVRIRAVGSVEFNNDESVAQGGEEYGNFIKMVVVKYMT